MTSCTSHCLRKRCQDNSSFATQTYSVNTELLYSPYQIFRKTGFDNSIVEDDLKQNPIKTWYYSMIWSTVVNMRRSDVLAWQLLDLEYYKPCQAKREVLESGCILNCKSTKKRKYPIQYPASSISMPSTKKYFYECMAWKWKSLLILIDVLDVARYNEEFLEHDLRNESIIQDCCKIFTVEIHSLSKPALLLSVAPICLRCSVLPISMTISEWCTTMMQRSFGSQKQTDKSTDAAHAPFRKQRPTQKTFRVRNWELWTRFCLHCQLVLPEYLYSITENGFVPTHHFLTYAAAFCGCIRLQMFQSFPRQSDRDLDKQLIEGAI